MLPLRSAAECSQSAQACASLPCPFPAPSIPVCLTPTGTKFAGHSTAPASTLASHLALLFRHFAPHISTLLLRLPEIRNIRAITNTATGTKKQAGQGHHLSSAEAWAVEMWKAQIPSHIRTASTAAGLPRCQTQTQALTWRLDTDGSSLSLGVVCFITRTIQRGL